HLHIDGARRTDWLPVRPHLGARPGVEDARRRKRIVLAARYTWRYPVAWGQLGHEAIAAPVGEDADTVASRDGATVTSPVSGLLRGWRREVGREGVAPEVERTRPVDCQAQALLALSPANLVGIDERPGGCDLGQEGDQARRLAASVTW